MFTLNDIKHLQSLREEIKVNVLAMIKLALRNVIKNYSDHSSIWTLGFTLLESSGQCDLYHWHLESLLKGVTLFNIVWVKLVALVKVYYRNYHQMLSAS